MFLALKEIRHSPLRFALLAGAVGLLVFLILFQNGLRDGLVTQFVGAIRNQSAPILVYGDQARKNLEGSQIPPDVEEAVRAAIPDSTVGRLGEGTFTVSTPVSRAEDDPADQLTDAALFGYELEGEAAGLGRPTTLVEGRLPERDGEAVASSRHADEGFDIGDVVRVEPDGLEIEVVGLADDISFSVSPTLFVSYPTYEQARRIRNPDATEVFPSVLLAEPAEGADEAATIDAIAAVEGTDPLTRQQAEDESPGVAAVRQSLDTVIRLLQFTVLLVIGLFLVILTVQKTPSLTLLRAVGASGWYLVGSLLVQAVLIVLAGVALGTALYALVTLGADDLGLSLSPGLVGGAAFGVLVAALVGSIAAVLRVLRIDPLDATRPMGALR